MQLPEFSRTLVRERTWPLLVDGLVFAALVAFIYALSGVTRYWFGAITPVVEISRSPWSLPRYAFYSLVRVGFAYLLSLMTAIGYGYLAFYSRRFESLMIAVLDILQSIPVLSFLPGVMLAMVSLVPSRQLGIEFGAIVLIFTGQVWNMAFSFYASLKAIPRELREAAAIYRFSRWQRFIQLELPYSVIGLVWNSMVSVAGGWFFLMACEMFVLGKRDFRLPGLGSYLQTAASAGDTPSILWGLAAMISVIVMLDQLVWRPAIVWADKFKFEQVERAGAPSSPILSLLRSSSAVRWVSRHAFAPLAERLAMRAAQPRPRPVSSARAFGTWPLAALLLAAVAYGLFQTAAALSGITRLDLIATLQGAGITFLRVNAALVIACAWTIPAGVAIGFHPRLARIAQPIAQVAASVPATALFPVVLLGLMRLGGGLGSGAVLLMLMGTQWYILFNVIAGAMAIPSDLKEVSAVFRFDAAARWRTVILPGIFPYLITGLVTASGGAWNASIVAEYFHFQGRTLSTPGLGAQISAATDAGNFRQLLFSTVVMAALVVSVNRLLWRRLYRLAETRYKLES